MAEHIIHNEAYPPEQIVRFVKRHHVLTLATSSDNGLWCANCFYAFDSTSGSLLFTTSPETRHGSDMQGNPMVAASIVLETRIVGKIQGLQITGSVQHADSEGRRVYIKRFPYAAACDIIIWELKPSVMKFTDNTLGFGKKLIWNRLVAQ